MDGVHFFNLFEAFGRSGSASRDGALRSHAPDAHALVLFSLLFSAREAAAAARATLSSHFMTNAFQLLTLYGYYLQQQQLQ